MIRHARPAPALAVPLLPVAMIELSFETLLVAPIGRAMLAQTRRTAAFQAAIALATVTARAEPEHRATFVGVAEPLSQNYFRVCSHVPSQAALDNGTSFVAG